MKCSICSNDIFYQTIVLKERLIFEWELAPKEVDYINRQQGYRCNKCHSNLRSISLANSVMHFFNFKGQFKQFCYSRYGRSLKILEINEAGSLHPVLMRFKQYYFAKYPEIDIQDLPYRDDFFDVVIHSDTLEHVENTSLALKECYRVLRNGGVLFYTIPIIYSRLTRRRDNLSHSFHGSQEETQGLDYKVITEYGADFWFEILSSGFTSFKIVTNGDNSSFPICAQKEIVSEYKKKVLLTVKSLNIQIINKIRKAIFK